MNLTISLLLLACMALANGQGLIGKSLSGYVFTVDATPYRGLSLDCLQIRAAGQARNWAAATDIYTKGRNMVRATGPKSLQSVSTAVRTGEPYYDLFARVYGANYVERISFGGPALTAAVGVERAVVGCQWLLLAYTAHELDVAKRVVATNSSLAVEETDDAFAIWFGYPNGLGLWNFFVQVEKWTPCAGAINTPAIAIFKAAKAAAGAASQARFNAQYNAVFRLIVTAYLRAIAYAGTKRNASLQKSAAAYVKVIQPFLVAKAQAAQLSAVLSSPALANPTTVRTLVQSVAALQKLTPRQVGIC